MSSRLEDPNPMRVAALYDIHGNLPALEALQRLKRAAEDRVRQAGAGMAANGAA